MISQKGQQSIVCYFWCEDGKWVGHSMRFDLRVDAPTLELAKRYLGESITLFVDEALASEPVHRDFLLRRHAPRTLSLALWLKYRAERYVRGLRTWSISRLGIDAPALNGAVA